MEPGHEGALFSMIKSLLIALLLLVTPAIAQEVTVAPVPSITGAWTPTDASGAGLAFTGVSGKYSQVGNIIIASVQLTFPVTGNAAQVSLTIPTTAPNQTWALAPSLVYTSGGTLAVIARPVSNTATTVFVVHGSSAAVTNANMSGLTIQINLIYQAS
jgi:hypothetical protein